jgi:hypothetical protein
MKFYIIPLSTFLFVASVFLVQAADEVKAPSSPYAQWKNGPPADPGFFPIAVWLQNPRDASRYKEAGINVYVALGRGANAEQLGLLKAAGIKAVVEARRGELPNKEDPTIIAWMHGDEPDNAQPIRDPETKKSKGYGPPIAPSKIVADYERLRSLDPTRPILLNLGQGVANDQWKGRGPQGKLEDYLTYVKGGDVISYDVYPVAGVSDQGNGAALWLVPNGIDRLKKWSEGSRILWNCIECTHINNAKAKATPQQVRAEVWMSLVHGSMGLIYFVHEFSPKQNSHALLDDPEMLAEVTRINKQIHSLAPVLNSPTLQGGVSVESSAADVPIDAIAKRLDGTTYVFSVGMRNGPAKATFRVRDLPADATAEVIGEGRSIKLKDGRFDDNFGPFDVHLYKIR